MVNTYKKILALALVIFSLFSCAFAEGGDKVVATFNGGEVTIDEVQNDLNVEISMMNTTLNYYAQLMGEGAYNMTEEDLKNIREYVIEAYAKFEILLNKMHELGIADLTDEEKTNLRANAEYYYLQYVYSYVQQGISADEAAYYLDMQGMSIDSIYENSYKNAVQNKLINALSVNEEVSEEDMQAQYEALVSEYETNYAKNPQTIETSVNSGNTAYFMPENMRYIKHIILTPEDETLADELEASVNQLTSYEAEYANLTSASYTPKYDDIVEKAIKEECLENIENAKKAVEAAQAKVLEAVLPEANEILAAIENGESFDSLIEKYSDDPGSFNEPIKSNGYLVYKDSTAWDEAFINAANALENVGDVSEPAVGSLGVYIVKYESEPVSGKIDFEAVKDAVAASVISARKSEAFKAQAEVWYEEANIQINLDAFN